MKVTEKNNTESFRENMTAAILLNRVGIFHFILMYNSSINREATKRVNKIIFGEDGVSTLLDNATLIKSSSNHGYLDNLISYNDMYDLNYTGKHSPCYTSTIDFMRLLYKNNKSLKMRLARKILEAKDNREIQAASANLANSSWFTILNALPAVIAISLSPLYALFYKTPQLMFNIAQNEPRIFHKIGKMLLAVLHVNIDNATSMVAVSIFMSAHLTYRILLGITPGFILQGMRRIPFIRNFIPEPSDQLVPTIITELLQAGKFIYNKFTSQQTIKQFKRQSSTSTAAKGSERSLTSIGSIFQFPRSPKHNNVLTLVSKKANDGDKENSSGSNNSYFTNPFKSKHGT